MKLRVAPWLVALSAVPLLGGAARLAGIAGVDGAPMDARFAQSPWPAGIHIAAAGLFSVMGAFQFERELRRAWPRWHRVVGRVLAVCGLLTAASGVWMTLHYAIALEHQGNLLFGVRLLVGGGMAASLVLALQAVLTGNVPSHEAWMLRAYALAQGAGTQVLFLLPPQLLTGQAATGMPRDVAMTAAWVANLLVAESVIRRRATVAVDPTPSPHDLRLASPGASSSRRARRDRSIGSQSPCAAASAASESPP